MIEAKELDGLRHTEYSSDPVVMDMLDTLSTLWKEKAKYEALAVAVRRWKEAYQGADAIKREAEMMTALGAIRAKP